MGQISWAIMLCMFERQLFLSTFSTMRSISFALRIHQIVSPVFNSESTNFFNKFIMIFKFFSNGKLRKNPVCFLFQLLILRKIRKKNWWKYLMNLLKDDYWLFRYLLGNFDTWKLCGFLLATILFSS